MSEEAGLSADDVRALLSEMRREEWERLMAAAELAGQGSAQAGPLSGFAWGTDYWIQRIARLAGVDVPADHDTLDELDESALLLVTGHAGAR